MANPEQCLRDGFSTGGSPGQGLGAIVRLSAESDFYSDVGRGTALLARWSAASADGNGQRQRGALRIGAVNVSKPGQEVCGDSWGVEQNEGECVVLVADGLGHGLEAQAASLEAVRMLHSNPETCDRLELLDRVHQALRSTRGAAVSVARIDRGEARPHLRGSRQCLRANLLGRAGQPASCLGQRHGRTPGAPDS